MNQDNNVYLDFAAATPLDSHVLEAMKPFLEDQFYNPSAIYTPAINLKKHLDSARAEVAGVIGAKPGEITFTAGATEANNIAIQGIARSYPAQHMISLSIEHKSVLNTLQHLDESALSRVSFIEPSVSGMIDLKRLNDAISDQTVLISVAYANSEIGTIQPVRQISLLIESVRSDRLKRGISLPIYLHTDAAQAGNYLDMHTSRLGVDLMTINGGKIYGPKQSGALYIKTGVNLSPLIYGGGQEKGIRPGTENVASSIGFACALKLSQDKRQDEEKRLKDISAKFMSKLEASGVTFTLNGSKIKRLANNIHLTFPGIDNERLMFDLDSRGFYVATGSACNASSNEPSYVLRAIGVSDDMARSSIRISMGRTTEAQNMFDLVETIKHIIKK